MKNKQKKIKNKQMILNPKPPYDELMRCNNNHAKKNVKLVFALISLLKLIMHEL